MEFLKRKHFSLWIITTFVLVASIVDGSTGLQGVPTWICLGLKSPFIEFSNELEILANTSIPLNITKDEQALMHQEGLRKLGTFIKPVDLRDSATGFVKANLTKKIPTTSMHTGGGGGGVVGGGVGAHAQRRLHPIQEEMDQKQIILLDEDTDENGLPASLTDEDRKFIVPMALKNASPDPRMIMAAPLAAASKITTTTRATTTARTTTSTAATPEFASNIDDLKKHILFLQNLTKHDSSFQSKFVVFPSLQKDKTGATAAATSTTQRPMRPIFQYSPPIAPPTRKSLIAPPKLTPGGQPYGGYYHNEDEVNMPVFLSSPREKITIVPQVLLLNDQTSEKSRNDPAAAQKDYTKRRNLMKNLNVAITATTGETTMTTTTTTTTSTTTEEPTTTYSSYNPKKPTKRPACLRNPESPKCIRQRRREEQQRQRDRERLLREQEQFLPPRFEPVMQTLNNTKRFAVSIEIPDSFKIPLNESNTEGAATTEMSVGYIASAVLSRSPRSHHKRRNIGGGLPGRMTGKNEKFAAKYGATYFERDTAALQHGTVGRDFLISNFDQYGNPVGMFPNGSTPSPTVAAYSEPIDLNPDNCYLVDGMSYGQKKQCVLHTSVMPAISRGARAAIQECQHQFKNRRWNCSTTDDITVFGPMTGLGSPEMAFIHALAAATVTSFIARACRDGQLASCGCSRGSRPKQLHDDWTWGGCGDDLEYAYKYATDFIDIREKETKRGTRGVGNPERKRGKFHQRRQQQQQQLQAMQADDAFAGASATTSMNDTRTRTGTTHDSSNTTDVSGRHIANNQENSNKTVNTVTDNKNGNGTTATRILASVAKDITTVASSSLAPPKQEQDSSSEKESVGGGGGGRIKPEDLLELQERIAKEISNSKLQEKQMLELQEKINREILNSKAFNMDTTTSRKKKKRKNQRAVNGNGGGSPMDVSYNPNMGQQTGGGGGGSTASASSGGKWKNGIAYKARSLMNLHNNEAGRRAVIKKTRITCKCHGVSGSCSLITCWQQLSSIREIGDYLREKYEESTEVKLNKRGRLQVKDPQFKVPTAHDLVYLDESPDWCRNNRQLQWPGTHGRVCNKTSSGLDGCGILCCGRGYNTKNIVVRDRCNCKFHWCCQVKCDVCVKVLEEHTCK